MNNFIQVSKYTVFLIVFLFLLLFWNTIFILQGAIDLDGPTHLLLLKLIPVFITSFVVTYLTIKMFDYKKKISAPKKTSLVVGGFAILLFLSFQHFFINRHLKPFNFENKNFSHLRPVKLLPNKFIYRMAISAAAYSKVMPLGQIDDETTSYISNIALESSLIFNIEKLVDENNIKNTCKQYIENNYRNGSCIIDLQNEVNSKYKFTTSGNLLLFTISTNGALEIKKIIEEKNGKKDLFAYLKSVNDVIETYLLYAARSKDFISTKSETIDFTMGHQMDKSLFIYSLEKQINYKFLSTGFDKIDGLLKKSNEKISKSKNGNFRKISGIDSNIEAEIKRFDELSLALSELQKNGFDGKTIKENLKTMHQDLELKFQKFKNKSLIFRISSFFKPELKKMTFEDLMKNKENEKSKSESSTKKTILPL